MVKRKPPGKRPSPAPEETPEETLDKTRKRKKAKVNSPAPLEAPAPRKSLRGSALTAACPPPKQTPKQKEKKTKQNKAAPPKLVERDAAYAALSHSEKEDRRRAAARVNAYGESLDDDGYVVENDEEVAAFVDGQLRNQCFDFRQRGDTKLTFHQQPVEFQSVDRHFLAFNPADYVSGGFVCRKCGKVFSLGSFAKHTVKKCKYFQMKLKNKTPPAGKTAHFGKSKETTGDSGGADDTDDDGTSNGAPAASTGGARKLRNRGAKKC